MDMPRPGEAHQKLATLAGDWEGEETMHPSPWGPGGPAKGRTRSRMSEDGFFLISDYEQEMHGSVCFRGHGVMGFDPHTQRYLWYWVDSMGMPPATATSGDFRGHDLVFENESPMGRHRYTYAPEGPDLYRFSMEASQDGGATWRPFMTGTYRRRR